MYIVSTQVTEAHHEALHEIHCREFHYFQKGTFPTYFRRDPAPLSSVKENYCFGARYTGLAEPPKQIFQLKTFALALAVLQVSADGYFFKNLRCLTTFPFAKTTFLNF